MKIPFNGQAFNRLISATWFLFLSLQEKYLFHSMCLSIMYLLSECRCFISIFTAVKVRNKKPIFEKSQENGVFLQLFQCCESQ